MSTAKWHNIAGSKKFFTLMGSFWPLVASMMLEVKNNYAHVKQW
jgi:hypothetical protein